MNGKVLKQKETWRISKNESLNHVFPPSFPPRAHTSQFLCFILLFRSFIFIFHHSHPLLSSIHSHPVHYYRWHTIVQLLVFMWRELAKIYNALCVLHTHVLIVMYEGIHLRSHIKAEQLPKKRTNCCLRTKIFSRNPEMTVTKKIIFRAFLTKFVSR